MFVITIFSFYIFPPVTFSAGKHCLISLSLFPFWWLFCLSLLDIIADSFSSSSSARNGVIQGCWFFTLEEDFWGFFSDQHFVSRFVFKYFSKCFRIISPCLGNLAAPAFVCLRPRLPYHVTPSFRNFYLMSWCPKGNASRFSPFLLFTKIMENNGK